MAKQIFASRSSADFDRIQAVIGGVDELAATMEQKWGVDRLPRLVEPDLATRFYSQARKFNAAITVGSPADVDVEGGRMINAWTALDAAAVAAGAPPVSPDIWEVALSNGTVVALVRSREEQHIVARAGRHVDVFSADEIARLIEGFPDIVKAKHTFPGAEITAVRIKPIDWAHGDELPDDLQTV